MTPLDDIARWAARRTNEWPPLDREVLAEARAVYGAIDDFPEDVLLYLVDMGVLAECGCGGATTFAGERCEGCTCAGREPEDTMPFGIRADGDAA